MARVGSKSRFLLSSSALAFSLVGYGRQAYAQACTQTGFNSYACAGVQDYTQYSFDGTNTIGPNITVSLNPTTILSTQQSAFPFNNLSGNTIEITGDGNLALISTRDVFLYSNDGSAAYILNDGTGANGNIFVSTQYRAPDPYGGTNWGFTGYASAITAINSSDGNITMNLNNRLEGSLAGVVVEQNGSGNVVVNQATVAGQYNGSGSITATGLGAGNNALDVDQNGTGSVSITVNGDITAAGGNAIDVNSGLNSTGTTIATGNGTISGGLNGINALNYGSGASMGITVGAGSVFGANANGIYALNATGTLNLTVTTLGGAVTGYGYGINAQNLGAGNLDINIGVGNVTGNNNAGILAINDGANLTIDTTTGAVTGQTAGIVADNNGTGELRITTGSGTVTGTSLDGIYASNSAAGTALTIEVGAGGVSGYQDGIDARQQGSGLLSITTSTGSVTGAGGDGIYASNTGSAGIYIGTNSGAILGGGDGIDARNFGGSITIDAGDGDITGQGGDGIYAYNGTGANAIAMTIDGAANITGSDNGIEARNRFGTGALSIDASGSTGLIRGQGGAGIYAYNGGSSLGGLTVTTGAGNGSGQAVLGYFDGINARSFGSGLVQITTGSGSVTGQNDDGIDARNFGGPGLIITTNAGTVSGFGNYGIAAYNYSGYLTISTGQGTDDGSGNLVAVYGYDDGINAYNSGTGLVQITTGTGRVIGQNDDGIDATNSGGIGMIITTNVGTVAGYGTGYGGNGIEARNYSGYLTISTGQGTDDGSGNLLAVYGYSDGINAVNSGSGLAQITTGTGRVIGQNDDGIDATNSGGIGMIITTNVGTVSGLGDNGIAAYNFTGYLTINTGLGTDDGSGNLVAVYGYYDGINAVNRGTGLVQITTGTGQVVGQNGDGIDAYNDGGLGLIITTNVGTVSGFGGNGIAASNYTGYLTINTGQGTDDGSGNLVAVYGSINGIYARNEGSGLAQITTGTGSVTGQNGDGIYAYNDGGSGLIITTNAGTVSGLGDRGIDARNYTGYLTINTGQGTDDGSGNLVAVYGYGDGINAFNRGSGLVQITTGTGRVIGQNDDGIDAWNDGGSGLIITTNVGTVSGLGGEGIEASNFTGYLTINTGLGTDDGSGNLIAVYGYNDGINAYNSGTGLVQITTGTGQVIGQNDDGIDARNDGGSGLIITTNVGTVSGLGAEGIRARNYTGYLTISTGQGTDDGSGNLVAVYGYNDGINAFNSGSGLVQITTGTGRVIGQIDDGIDAFNSGGSGLIITTNVGTVSGLGDNGIVASNLTGYLTINTGLGTDDGSGNLIAVYGRDDGINAYNLGTGLVQITTGTGQVIGEYGEGIDAFNSGGSGLIITTNVGTVSGFGGDGIRARNYTGYLTINTGLGTDDGSGNLVAVYGYVDGIYAVNTGTGNLSISTGSGSVIGETDDGIDARNYGPSALVITTAGGAIFGNGDNGIFAYNSYNGTYIDITTGTGAVQGATNGIFANNNGSSYLDIVTNGAVTGLGGDGIRADNGYFSGPFGGLYGTDLTITTNAAVLGTNGNGIYATNIGDGELLIDANAAVTGTGGDGIRALNGYSYYATYGSNLTILADDSVTGSENGIYAINRGTGAVYILAQSDVTGQNGDGIYARNGAQNSYYGYNTGTDLTIVTNGPVLGTNGDGIEAINTGNGSVLIQTNSTVEGTGGDGIRASNGIGFYGYVYGANLVIEADDSVTGSVNGIVATNLGTGYLSITAQGPVVGSGGDGILAENGVYYAGTLYGTDLSIAVYGDVTGGNGDGIQATNIGAGDLTIAAIGSGTIQGYAGDGILATNGTYRNFSPYGRNLTIASDKEIIGSENGIRATNTGTGYLDILANADVTGQNGDGIQASNGFVGTFGVFGTNLTITANGNVLGSGGDGIEATNVGDGDLTIFTYGTVEGGAGDGIRASNGSNRSGTYSYGRNLTIYSALAVTGSANGIFASNTGTGYIDIQTEGAVTGAGGDGIYARNGDYNGFGYYVGTDITINANGPVLGGGGDGIEAINTGTGSIFITTVDTVDGDAGDGIRAINGTALGGDSIEITTGPGAVTGSASGIFALNSGTGDITIDTTGNVSGNGGAGIYAANSSYGGGISVTTGSGSTVYGSTVGIFAANNGSGAVDITVYGNVTGNSLDGIYAFNSGNGTGLTVYSGLGTVVEGGQNGINAINDGSGSIVVTAYGDAIGNNGYGIQTVQDSGGFDTQITVGGGSTVEGTLGGIGAYSTNGSPITIQNDGLVRNLSLLDSALAISASGGPVGLVNDNQILGRVNLSGLDDIFTNGGLWTTQGVSDFGLGDDLLTNNGTIVLANSAGAGEATTFAGLENFANNGVIDMSDGAAGDGTNISDTLLVEGNFNGGIGSVLQIDAFLGGPGSVADVLTITGTVTGQTSLTVLNTNPGGGAIIPGNGILVVDAGSAVGTEFVLAGGPITSGVVIYDLFFDAANSDFYLQTTLNPVNFDSVLLLAAAADIWQITATGWQRNTAYLAKEGGGAGVSRGGSTPSSGGTGVVPPAPSQASGTAIGWGSFIYDRRDFNATIIADVTGTPTAVDIDYLQKTTAAIGGVDWNFTPDEAGGRLTFGALLGVIKSDVEFQSTGNSAEFDGPTYGVRVGYVTDRFRGDLLVKRDDLDLSYTVPALAMTGESVGNSKAVSTGASLEVAYAVFENDQVTVEAVGNLSQVRTSIDPFTIQGLAFDFGDTTTTRGAVGVTFTGNYAVGSTMVTPSATIKYWNVFDGGYASSLDAVVFNYDGTGGYGEVSAGLEFNDPDSGWSGFLQGSGFFGSEQDGIRAQLGVNFEF